MWASRSGLLTECTQTDDLPALRIHNLILHVKAGFYGITTGLLGIKSSVHDFAQVPQFGLHNDSRILQGASTRASLGIKAEALAKRVNHGVLLIHVSPAGQLRNLHMQMPQLPRPLRCSLPH